MRVVEAMRAGEVHLRGNKQCTLLRVNCAACYTDPVLNGALEKYRAPGHHYFLFPLLLFPEKKKNRCSSLFRVLMKCVCVTLPMRLVLHPFIVFFDVDLRGVIDSFLGLER